MNMSSENILARNVSSNGRGGYTIGSEMSGGIRNVTFEDSTSTGESGIRISSQPGRGGFVTDVTVRRVDFRWKASAKKSFLFHVNQERICKPAGCSGGPKCGFACDNPNACECGMRVSLPVAVNPAFLCPLILSRRNCGSNA